MPSVFKKLFKKRAKPDDEINTILVVDDDAYLCDNLIDILEGDGYKVFSASSRSDALKVAREHMPWLALVDLKLPDGSGASLLYELKKIKHDSLAIIMTAHADVDSAVDAIEKGAFYYLQKPVKPAELIELVDLAFETIRLKDEKRKTEEELRARNKELEEIIARLKGIIGDAAK
jgi:DNA-binding NtrC family response regulator